MSPGDPLIGNHASGMPQPAQRFYHWTLTKQAAYQGPETQQWKYHTRFAFLSMITPP